MDVLLVLVPSPVLRKFYRDHVCSPPLGLLYLSAYLKETLGLRADLIDLQRDEWSLEGFREQLATGRPKIVGLSVSTEAHQNAQDIATAVKSVLPSALVVLGGAHATFVGPEEFRQWRHVDVLVRGEGEITFTELVRHVLRYPGARSLDQIAGLTFKADAEVRVNPRRELIADLDSLPFPDWALVDGPVRQGAYRFPFTISTSRGCPGNCIFCSSRAFWGNKVRFRSPTNILAELTVLMKEYHMRSFHIIDDTFTARPSAVVEFCRLLGSQGIEAEWSCASRVDVITAELLQRMYDAGCRAIQFGIESGVQEVLDAIGKHVTVEQIEQAVRLAHRLPGLGVAGTFMIGHYCDTPATMLQTIHFVKKLADLYGMAPVMSMNTPFPGTPQFVNRARLGLTIHARRWEDFMFRNPQISASHFSLDDLRSISNYGWTLLNNPEIDPFPG
jgi:anaerobic magnesium-protoporphyrin IX monomethyl ester cyclase